MLIQVDKVFVASSSVSELVWSPCKGLDLISTDLSSTKNKPSLLWNNESFEIIHPDPPHRRGGGSSFVGDDCVHGNEENIIIEEETLLPLRSVQNSENMNNIKETKGAIGISNEQKSTPSVQNSEKNAEDLLDSPVKIVESENSEIKSNPGFEVGENAKISRSDGKDGDGRTQGNELTFFNRFLANQAGVDPVVRREEPLANLKDDYEKMLAKGKFIMTELHEHVGVSKKMKTADNIHESIESNNHSREFSNMKRKWCFESGSVSGKKLKKVVDGSSFLVGSFLERNSSFMNLVSSVAKDCSSSIPVPTAASSVLPLKPANGCNSGSLICLEKKGNDCARTTGSLGFQSFIRALCNPRSKAQPTTQSREELKLQTRLPLSTFKHVDHNRRDFDESPTEEDVTNTNTNTNTAVDGVSSSFSGKTQNKLSGCLPRSEFLSNIWLSRLCPPKAIPSVYCSTAVETQQPTSSLDSSSSKEMSINNDNNPKLNLKRDHPIISSPLLKKLKPMNTVFAKRLDAFRRIKPSDVTGNMLCSTLVCFFCGQTGHSIQDCSEIKGSEFEILQKNIIDDNNTQKNSTSLSCLCIRCFQLSHWAISCPFLSKEKNLSNHPHGGEEKQTNLESTPDSEILALVANRVIPVYNLWRNDAIDVEQVRVFDGIRQLRLSRTDLTRNLKLHSSDLEGYFVRVRYRERSYKVASICEKSLDGRSNWPLSSQGSHVTVNINGLKCTIDCRFVSNTDFNEEELVAWWFETVKCGGKPPSQGQLTRKLQHRKKFSI